MGAVIAHRQLDTPRCATHPSNEEKLSINKTMTLDTYKYAAGEAKPTKASRDSKREKRLERNRESARKCRKKRKAYVGDLQQQVDSYAEENAVLQLENERLLQIINQLQGGLAPAMTMDDLPVSAPKRRKSENGVLMANDLSGSAVHTNQHNSSSCAKSQQLDYPKLAISTTFLLYSPTVTALA